MAKQLIVNADDLGISLGVSRGIIEAHLNGIVTSTSLMANLPDAPEALQMVKTQAPRMGVGLHLVLSFGAPAAPDVPSLHYADGRFPQDYHQLMEALPNFSADDLHTEFTAQMNRFIELTGHLPDHIDSHHGSAYFHPAAFDVLCKLATQYRLPIRNGEWWFKPEAVNHIAPRLGRKPAELSRQLREIYETQGSPRWPQNADLGASFYDETVTLDNLLTMIRNVPEGITEIGCHPGYVYDLDEPYAAPREVERGILTDARVKEAVQQAGVEMVSYGVFR